MRIPALLLAAAVLAGPSAAEPKRSTPLAGKESCPKTSSYLAEQIGSYRGKRLEPKRLDKLPSATAYMAVYRQVNGCEAPLTMVDYRNGPRR